MKLQFAPLCREHDRKHFDCGEPGMNEYIHQYLAQQARHWDTTCQVLEDADTHEMIGFFTVNPFSIPRRDLPLGIHSAYETASVYLLGRLAVSVKHQGKGYGRLLLDEAVDLLTSRNSPRALGMLVELKSSDLQGFYENYGFTPITGHSASGLMRMFFAFTPAPSLPSLGHP